MSENTPRVFAPVTIESRFPKVLLGAVGGVLLASALLMAAIAAGNGRVRYIFQGSQIIIRTGSLLDGSRRFSAGAVSGARAVQVTASRRERGTALPGYCTGRFWHPETGSVWEASNCSRAGVLLSVKGESSEIFLTPPDARKFLELVRFPRDRVIDLPEGKVGGFRVLTGIAGALLTLLIPLVAATFVVAPKRMKYAVSRGTLTVRTLFATRSWPLSESNARSYGPTTPMRIAGSAFPGYYTGLFREGGRNLRVYATDLRRGVLLEGPQRVYLSPADREGFLAALQAEGARIEDGIGA